MYYLSINNVRAHIQSYPHISILFASCLRFFTVGILFSYNITLLLLFLYSLRECYQSIQSSIATCCLSIIISELLLFVAYFWGGFHFMWSNAIESIILPSTRSLILSITLLLSTASIIIGYVYCIREKAICMGSSCMIMILFTGGLFTTLQISEFLYLQFSFNDSVIGCITLSLTSLHFSHVLVGLIILLFNFWSMHTQYISNIHWNGYMGYSTILMPQLEYFTLLYWHFVEILWLFIQFVFYTE